MMESVRGWLYLRSIKGLGNVSLKRLFERFYSTKAILSADEDELSEVVGKSKARAILQGKGVDPESIDRLLEITSENGIRVISFED